MAIQTQAAPAASPAATGEAAQSAPESPSQSEGGGDFSKLMEAVAQQRSSLMQLAKDYPEMQGGVKGAIEALVQGLTKAGKSSGEASKGVRY
jgi:hypothetical protein